MDNRVESQTLRKAALGIGCVAGLIALASTVCCWIAPFSLISDGRGGYSQNPLKDRALVAGLLAALVESILGSFGKGKSRVAVVLSGPLLIISSLLGCWTAIRSCNETASTQIPIPDERASHLSGNYSFEEKTMISSSPRLMRFASLAFCAMFATSVVAQQAVPATPAPAPTGTPTDSTAPTTAVSLPTGTMNKSDLKSQRKQQKRDEDASKANANAAKARAKMAKSQTRSKVANDKALQAQEKAGQVTQTPPPADTATTAPPQ